MKDQADGKEHRLVVLAKRFDGLTNAVLAYAERNGDPLQDRVNTRMLSAVNAIYEYITQVEKDLGTPLAIRQQAEKARMGILDKEGEV